ncbi:MAG: redoxin domain-containing protein [Bacteroidaceae bacterium]|nr:redoxin domain-containing protein [Bacteroidaceae bacterium]
MRRRKRDNINQRIMTGVIAMALLVLVISYLFLTMVSCTDDTRQRFHVEGSISDATDSTLILEAMMLDSISDMGHVKLSQEGAFSFDIVADTASNPEFYRLRIGNRHINFVVDSTETITVIAALTDMSVNYDIQGNDDSRQIKTISQLAIQLQMQLAALRNDASLTEYQRTQRAYQLIEQYKNTLKADYILPNPASAAAYYALFQTINGQMVFDPLNNRDDVRYFSAVATQWNDLYPNSLRTQNLVNIALRGHRNTRVPRQVELEIDSTKIRQTGIIDFGFPDIRGREHRLSDYPDNVVLLDFTAYSLPNSPQRNLELRDLYIRYHDRGLEIYQVSLDANEHYWKTVSENLPWVCVYCSEGIANDMVRLYQVNQLPTYFIIGRGSEMKYRAEQITDINATIEQELGL